MKKSLLIITLILLTGFAAGGRYKPTVTSSKCTGCTECVAVCPVSAIEKVREKAIIDPNKCVGCGQCVAICSWGAVK
jgi:ferredoxin